MHDRPQWGDSIEAGATHSRSEGQLRERQERGTLRVRSAAGFRALAGDQGLERAYADTDVVVAADAGFSDQASLSLSLGPSDPPIRLRQAGLGGVAGLASGGPGELVLPVGGGLADPAGHSGAQLLAALLAGEPLAFDASGEGTACHPRRELHTELRLNQIGTGRLLLHRAIAENGVVAVSSSDGLCASPWGPVLGPYATALWSCGGAGSIGLTMPGLSLLGPGSPVLVAGSIGWVLGAGSGHQPGARRQASGHALTPGATAAVSVDLHNLEGRWLRPCFIAGHGCALLVAIAAPVPLLNLEVARRAATGPDQLQATVLDLAIPRRIKPALGSVSYAELASGRIVVGGRKLRSAPAHSPRLAAEITAELVSRLEQNRFPIRLPVLPLSARPGLLPIDS
jgi:uncharacterized protein (DUF39 family)